MEEQIIKIIQRGKNRVHILLRSDGAFTYHTQNQSQGDWGPMGLDCGIYDSPETAEEEANSRIWWLRKPL